MEKIYRFPQPCMVYRNTHIMSALATALRDGDGAVVNKIIDHEFAAYVTGGTEAKIFAHLEQSGMLMVEVSGLTGKWMVHPSSIEPVGEEAGCDRCLPHSS